MSGNLKQWVVCAALALGGAAMAQDAAAPAEAPKTPVAEPSADEVKRTWDYFYKGQGQGVVLGEAKLCTDVAKAGDNKFECTAEVPAEGVKAGTTVLVWQAWLVPQNDSLEDLAVQLKQGNTVRETKDIKVKGESMRTRTWTGVRLPKAGKYTIALIRGDKIFKSFEVKAF
jgi:hypothetical protein